MMIKGQALPDSRASAAFRPAYRRRLQGTIRSDAAPCRRRSAIGGNPENICSLRAFRILTRNRLETGNCRRRAASFASCKPSQCSQPDSLGKLTNGQPIHHARPMHVDRACASELRACATELAQLFGVGAIGDHKALGLSFPLARTSISRLIEIEQRGQRYF